MSWTTVRGLSCLAMMLLAATGSQGQDAMYSVASTDFGKLDLSLESSDSLTGIDRLLEVNSVQDSVFRPEPAQLGTEVDSRGAQVGESIAPIGSTSGSKQGLYFIVGCCAACALGLGLCCVSLFSGRRRTINTFSAGFVRVQ